MDTVTITNVPRARAPPPGTAGLLALPELRIITVGLLPEPEAKG